MPVVVLFDSMQHRVGSTFSRFALSPVITSLKGMCLSPGVCVHFHFHNKSTSTLWSSSKMRYDVKKRQSIEKV